MKRKKIRHEQNNKIRPPPFPPPKKNKKKKMNKKEKKEQPVRFEPRKYSLLFILTHLAYRANGNKLWYIGQ